MSVFYIIHLLQSVVSDIQWEAHTTFWLGGIQLVIMTAWNINADPMLF